MELLIITLVASVIAVVGQLGDSTGVKFGATGA